MYSEQGFEARIGPLCGQVCQRLMVLSYCNPGSPHTQAASAISRSSSRAGTRVTTSPLVRATVSHSRSSSTARMNSSVTRTEWLAFW